MTHINTPIFLELSSSKRRWMVLAFVFTYPSVSPYNTTLFLSFFLPLPLNILLVTWKDPQTQKYVHLYYNCFSWKYKCLYCTYCQCSVQDTWGKVRPSRTCFSPSFLATHTYVYIWGTSILSYIFLVLMKIFILGGGHPNFCFFFFLKQEKQIYANSIWRIVKMYASK